MEKNPYFVITPQTGVVYKLWTLPQGTQVQRQGLAVDGRLAETFTVTKQNGTFADCKTTWGYEFYLDASLDVIAS